MADPIDELALRWKRNPDAASTIALCDALRANSRPTLVQQVGETATQRHGGDVPVLVAVARMYLDAQRLSDAQAVLVTAGKISPRDAAIYRWLGEVLLRRGDADRAEKVLERSISLGMNDADTRLWLDRARVFKPVQAKAGARAVAMEVAQAAPQPPPARGKMDSLGDDSTTHVRVMPERSEDSVSEGTTAVRAAPTPPPAFFPKDDRDLSIQDDEPTKLRLDPPSGGGPGRPHNRDPATVPVPTPMGVLRSALDDALARAGGDGVSDFASTLKDPKAKPPPLPDHHGGRAGQNAVLPSVVVAEKTGVPSPNDVLQALSLAGVFEPPGSAPVPLLWTRPNEKIRRGTTVALTFAMLLLVGAGFFTFRFVKDRRDKEHQAAEALLAKIETDMHASRASLLPSMEQAIGQAFELDSRSKRAALDWLRERAMVGLVKSGADVAFEDAISRAKEVGVRDEDIAFARLASFLYQGDTAGAAALLSRWDGPAANDAWYQLIAGSTLEHAGDARAGERYAQAAKLDTDLIAAQVAAARQIAIEGDPQKAAEAAKQFRTKYPDRPEGAALVALAWAQDPERGEQPPPEVAEMLAHAAELPIGLQAVPHALIAIAAVDKHAFPDAKAEVEKGLTVADGPGVASWLGDIALATGDEQLGRKAALVAVSFSAVYPPARALAARVALLGGRFDEALKATEELDANTPEVAVVRAAASYERVDSDGLSRALEALSSEAKQLPFLNAVVLASSALVGKAQLSPQKILDMSDDEAPWSDLVAMDLALDLGDLDVADRIAQAWKDTDSRPLRAQRLSRLARYENRLDDADRLSRTALESGTVTTRTLEERVFVLVARNKQSEVGPLLAKYPLVLGPNAAWLSAYANATAGKLAEALGKVASLDAPPALAPLPSRIMAAVALAAMKDHRRGVDYIAPILGAGIQDPDLVAAALSLGFRKVEHRRTVLK